MKLDWKPVQLEECFFANGIPEGLVGIEECTDYGNTSLQKQKRKKTKSVASDRCKKRKTVKDTGSSEKSEVLTPSKCGSTLDINDTEDNGTINVDAWKAYGLQEPLLKALSDQNFRTPTPIQALTLPFAIGEKKDILGAAETGSGKTLAFGLPILSGIISLKNDLDTSSKDSRKPLYALILTPTRELAMQVKKHLTDVAKYTDIKISVVVGGMSAEKQERLLNKQPEIVVATPGRLWELIQLGNIHLSQIDKISYLAIDETDRMLEKGHFQELHQILEKINFMQSEHVTRQHFVFSATLTLEHELPKRKILENKLKKRKKSDHVTSEYKLKKIINLLGIKNPKVVDVTKKDDKVAENLTECRIFCKMEEKDYYVYYFLKKFPGRTLIFCNSIGCVKRLSNLLTVLQCNVLAFHASMQQRQRLKNLDRFKSVPDSVLIATDVAARGLDIPSVDHVLHYQIPKTSESYVHRSGRTARASKDGITILLIEPSELQNYLRICRTLGRESDMPTFPVQQNILAAVKHRIDLATEIEKLELHYRKNKSSKGWLQKTASEMDIIIDDTLLKEEEENEEIDNSSKRVQMKRKQLSYLLSQPVFAPGFSGKYPDVANFSKVLFKEEDKKAITVAKNAMESSKGRKKPKWLFKKKIL